MPGTLRAGCFRWLLGVAHFAIDGNEGIVEVYASSINRPDPDDYILDNYLGMHRSDPAIVAAATAPERQAESTIQDSGFQEGDFEGLGSLHGDAMATVFPDFADDVYALWKTMVTDPATILSTLWDFTGDVELVADSDNTLVQLTQTADTSLGQNVLIGGNAAALQFDLTVTAAQAGQTLEVLFNDELLTTVPLDDKPRAVAVPLSIPVAQLAGSDGLMTFRLTGPTATPSVVRIDNIELTAPLAPADFDQDGVVDGADFLAWQRGMGAMSGAARPDGDADGDGAVDGDDLTLWRDGFGNASNLVSGLSSSVAAGRSADALAPQPTWFIVEPTVAAGRAPFSRVQSRQAAGEEGLVQTATARATPQVLAWALDALSPLAERAAAESLEAQLANGVPLSAVLEIDELMTDWPTVSRRASRAI
jgi:hypothetical protein